MEVSGNGNAPKRPYKIKITPNNIIVFSNEVCSHFGVEKQEKIMPDNIIVSGEKITPDNIIVSSEEINLHSCIEEQEEINEKETVKNNGSNTVFSGKTQKKARITGLVLEAAAKIEEETGKLASVNEVFEKLRQWANGSDHPELKDDPPYGIKWITNRGNEKKYDKDACRKTLSRHRGQYPATEDTMKLNK